MTPWLSWPVRVPSTRKCAIDRASSGDEPTRSNTARTRVRTLSAGTRFPANSAIRSAPRLGFARQHGMRRRLGLFAPRGDRTAAASHARSFTLVNQRYFARAVDFPVNRTITCGQAHLREERPVGENNKLELVADVVSSYLRRNSVGAEQIGN